MSETRRGRPRSEQARQAVLDATRDLLGAEGYERMSIEGIAVRAGVGKQTVYRWWNSKAAVVADAVLDGAIPMAPIAVPDTGDLRLDLSVWLERMVSQLSRPEHASLIRALASAVSADQDTGGELYERFIGPDRTLVTVRLAAGVTTGQVRSDSDLDAAADAMIGGLVYLVLVRQEVTVDRARGLLDVILSGIAVS